jgi:hypothetical protein
MGQAHALVNLFLFLALPVASLILAVVVGTALVNPSGNAKLALAFYVSGFALFLVAKISLFRSGRLITFDARPMRPGYQVVYRTGYALMIVGALFAFGLLLRGDSEGFPTLGARSTPVGDAPSGTR